MLALVADAEQIGIEDPAGTIEVQAKIPHRNGEPAILTIVENRTVAVRFPSAEGVLPANRWSFIRGCGPRWRSHPLRSVNRLVREG